MSNILADGELLLNLLTFQPISESCSDDTAKMRLRNVERMHIMRVLEQCGGNKSQAARELGISLNTLYNRLNSYGLAPAR